MWTAPQRTSGWICQCTCTVFNVCNLLLSYPSYWQTVILHLNTSDWLSLKRAFRNISESMCALIQQRKARSINLFDYYIKTNLRHHLLVISFLIIFIKNKRFSKPKCLQSITVLKLLKNYLKVIYRTSLRQNEMSDLGIDFSLNPCNHVLSCGEVFEISSFSHAEWISFDDQM